MRSDASIVIPVFNNAQLTKDCLERVLETTGDLACEIIVVDNASTDGTAEMLAGFGDAVVTITNAENLGFTIASNQGAFRGDGRHIVFLNNDTLPEPGWLEWLVRTADGDDTVGAVGSKLVYPDGVLQEAGGIVFSDGNGWNYGRGRHPDHPKYRFVREVDYCSGASLLVKREVFDKLGGFDERYAPAYFEDSDLCFGVRSLGLRVLYQPRSVVVHLEGRTAGTDTSSGLKRYQDLNRPKFVEKWRDVLPEQWENSPANVEKACIRGTTRDILMMHPTLPAYDISSGDMRFYRTMMILRGLGARLTFVARASRPADRARYLPDLEQAGIEVYPCDPMHVGEPFGPESHALDFAQLLVERQPDVAVMSHFDTTPLYADEIRFLSPGTEIICDSHDVHYLREYRQAQLAGDEKHLRGALSMRRRELATYCRCDLVFTVTDEDKRYLKEELPRLRVEVTPNIHDVVNDEPGFDEREGLIFVGYFLHTPNVDAMRFFVGDVFPLVREKLPGVKLWIVGSHPTDEILGMAADDIEVTGYVPETRPYLDAARISVAPLRYGAGMKGKIGEAMQFGIPVVTTSIGAEGMDLEDGVHALIADDPADFAAKVVRLYTDKRLWESVAANAKKQIDDAYSTRVQTQRLREAFGFPDAAREGRA